MVDQLLKQEIASVLDFISKASDSWRDFTLGKLTALLWIQSRGALSQADCFTRAADAWDNLRREVEAP